MDGLYDCNLKKKVYFIVFFLMLLVRTEVSSNLTVFYSVSIKR